MYIGVIMILIIASVRWVFSIHLIILERKTAWQGLRISRNIIKKHWKMFLGVAFGVNLLLFLAALLLFVLISLVGMGVLYLFSLGTPGINEDIAIPGFASLVTVCIFVGSFAVLPIEVHFFTRLYYRFSGKLAVPLKLKSKSGKGLKLDRWLAKPKVMTVLVIVGILIATAITTFVVDDLKNEVVRVEITAHRGSSMEAPENTLSAIGVAIKNKADYVEIDVQVTRDGELILLHDSTFKRTGGIDVLPSELTLEEVKDLDVGSWFHEAFAGEKVPTLQEVIDFTKGKIKLNIEIKGDSDDEGLVKKIIKTIKANKLLDTCVVTSLDYQIIQMVEREEPRIKTGYIMFLAIGDLRDINVDFYSVEMSNVTVKFVNKAHLLGRQIHVWTVNEEDDMESMMFMGVDNIITDYDATLRTYIDSYNSGMWEEFFSEENVIRKLMQ